MQIPSISTSAIKTLGPTQGNTLLEEAGAENSFQSMLLSAINQTREMGQDSQSKVEANLVGDDVSMIETFTAVRKADLALRAMMQVRNKLVDAWQEIQQMRF